MNKIKGRILLVFVVVGAMFCLFKVFPPTADSKQVSSFQQVSVVPPKDNLLYPTELSKKNKLIQEVLDIPRFQILSKPPYLRRFPKIFFFVSDESDSTSNANYYLRFDDIELVKMETVEGKDLEFTPCFEVSIFSYSGEHAEVWVELDATGALATGYLHFHNGEWIPDAKFQVGLK